MFNEDFFNGTEIIIVIQVPGSKGLDSQNEEERGCEVISSDCLAVIQKQELFLARAYIAFLSLTSFCGLVCLPQKTNTSSARQQCG